MDNQHTDNQNADNQHADNQNADNEVQQVVGNSDDIFRSMRRNCEAYKKKDMELIRANQEIESLKQEIKKLTIELNRKNSNLITWTDYILYVCRDGEQRTSKEIFNEIKSMDTHPYTDNAKTPDSTCNSKCGNLFKKDKLCKTNDTPTKYFVLI